MSFSLQPRQKYRDIVRQVTAASSQAVQSLFTFDMQPRNKGAEPFKGPVEPALDAVLSFVLAHARDHARCTYSSANLAQHPSVSSPALFQYCQHVLQWPELRQQVADWLLIEKNESVRHTLQMLLDASEPDQPGDRDGLGRTTELTY